jgi:hypothetical protein
VDQPTPRDDETSSARTSPPDEPEGEEKSSTPGKPVDEPTGESDESPVSEPPGSDAKAPKEPRRTNEFWLGALGVVATMLVGVVGAVATYFTGVQHDKQETLRAQASFNRSEQVQAYNKFLYAITAFDHALRYEYQIIDPPTAPARSVSRPERDFAQSQQDLAEATVGLTFYGTPDVMRTLTGVLTAANRLKGNLADWELHHSTDKESAHNWKCGQQNPLNDLLLAQAKFSAAGRKDLGLSSVADLNILFISICDNP